ncbi:MAG TPA: hypothetical protein VGQ24_02775 [Gemmatimonadales bacterium]|jgi:hypothetical protein|nr:hypothetical protein [Gemmatimonadales bacterium]
MPVDEIPNPGQGALAADGNGDGDGGGGGGGGGCSNSNSHNRAQVSLQDITSVINQLARTLPAVEGGSSEAPPR